MQFVRSLASVRHPSTTSRSQCPSPYLDAGLTLLLLERCYKPNSPKYFQMRLLLPIPSLTTALSLRTKKPQARRLKTHNSLSQRRSAQLTAKIVQSAMKRCPVGTKTTSPLLFFVRCAVTAFTRSASNNVRFRVSWYLAFVLIAL